MTPTARPMRLSEAQREAAIHVMARAFYDDPFLKFLAPDDARRRELTPEFVSTVVKYCLLDGEAWTMPNVEGVACWLAPGKTSPSFMNVIRTGMLLMPLKFGWAGFQRFNAAIGYTEALHKQFAPGPHWYLWGLGVDPAHQRKGIAKALLQPTLAQADAAQMPCYLETQNETNLAFYRQLGFEVASSGTVPQHDLAVWALVRPPQAVS